MPVKNFLHLVRHAKKQASDVLLTLRSRGHPREGKADPMHSLFIQYCPLIGPSLKTHQGCEGDTAYTTPHSVLSGTVPREKSSRPDSPLPGSESSVASITAELRLGRKRSVLFTHEATGINLTSSIVAEMLEEYGKPIVFSFSTCSRLLDTISIYTRSSRYCLTQPP